MDGFRCVKLNEVIRQVDIVITCTGMSSLVCCGTLVGVNIALFDTMFHWWSLTDSNSSVFALSLVM